MIFDSVDGSIDVVSNHYLPTMGMNPARTIPIRITLFDIFQRTFGFFGARGRASRIFLREIRILRRVLRVVTHISRKTFRKRGRRTPWQKPRKQIGAQTTKDFTKKSQTAAATVQIYQTGRLAMTNSLINSRMGLYVNGEKAPSRRGRASGPIDIRNIIESFKIEMKDRDCGERK